MSRHWTVATALPLLLTSVLAAQAAPSRQVHGNALVSWADPPATLIFAPAFRYAGGQAIDILTVAGAEQYFFIQAAADSAIRRFYWVQFEHYYPTNTYEYDYSEVPGQEPVSLGRLEFLGDIRVGPNYFTDDDRPGSDSKAAEEFLRARGFKIGGTFVTLRMFHFPDTTRRRELMIIYGEFLPDSSAEQRIKSEITSHAQAGISIPP